MIITKSKHVQGTIPIEDYEDLKFYAEKEGKTIKDIIYESIRLWLMQKRGKKGDSLFQTKAMFEGPEKMAENHDDQY
ncbi:MAG: hypothetical protein ACXADA_22535 [Candidatus Hodarchaeales archaeon]